MTRLRRLTAALWIMLAVSELACGQNDGYQPQAGQLHPQFVLPRIDTRERVSLSAFRGKKVLLIHFASW